MTIKSRLKAVERKISPRERPRVFTYSILFEGSDPSKNAGLAMAWVLDSAHFDQAEKIHPERGESLPGFKRRVCDMVAERTGSRPVNECELMDEGEGA